MRKIATVIALTLALGIVTPAKPHPRHQETPQAKVGDSSDTDAWRHYLLHTAAAMSTPAPEGLGGDVLTIMNTTRKFRAEFEKAIDDFNASQENRIEADQIIALNNFIAQRDAMVASYKHELLSALTPEVQSEFVTEVEKSKGTIRSAVTGDGCGIPNQITCSITFSWYPIVGGMNPDYSFRLGSNQILDGAATMVGNPQHARHTPTVTLTIVGEQHTNSGKSVCADCYLYVNANVFFTAEVGGGYDPRGEGVVVCSEAGKFVDSTPGEE